jgi:hypothetical protein
MMAISSPGTVSLHSTTNVVSVLSAPASAGTAPLGVADEPRALGQRRGAPGTPTRPPLTPTPSSTTRQAGAAAAGAAAPLVSCSYDGGASAPQRAPVDDHLRALSDAPNNAAERGGAPWRWRAAWQS